VAQSNLVEDAKALYAKGRKWLGGDEPKKVDPTWHAKAVNEATESFSKKAPEPAKSTGKRKVGGAAKDRTVAKRVAPKGGPRKLASKQYGY
jgi:hypothetical protein